MSSDPNLEGIAIIGMAGRFPGARNVADFWRNLENGVESIRVFSPEEIQRAGQDASAPDFVPARSILEDVDLFDAPLFGIDAREAELMDPQHRVFLETAWEALENAGCDPERYPGAIGLYAGLSLNTYLLSNLCPDRAAIEHIARSYQSAEFQTILGNDKDFLTTRVAYKLNLRGPVMTVQTACSTSLVAVAQACQSLQNFQCDMAMAGAVSITFPQTRGYQYQEGAMGSADGHCRTFDADARGTVFGDGCGIVVLKRLADAVADGDCIHAVIKGSAVNNDGSAKVSYTAPGVEGQTEVIAAAQALANTPPDTIGYIEAHGTATPLGDPIEIAALTRAFRLGTEKKQFCAIGSAKTNFGHLDAASGVTGLIKTALALEHGVIPPSLHFKRPNPHIDFQNSPFFVNTERREWRRGPDHPRRAGISSFGVGGTNAHVVLEEAPELPARTEAAGPQVLVLSARSREALDHATGALAAHLEAHPELDLRDIAFTLQTGRKAFDFRRFAVCGGTEEAARALRSGDPAHVFTRGGRLPAPDSPQLAAGRAFLMAQRVDWDALHAGASPRRVPLPSYPFERKRYWIEPKHETAPAPAAPAPVAISAAPGATRKETLLAEVRGVFAELSGENLSEADPRTSFFDLGLDSLFLTQAAQALRKKFNVKITFRQLLDDLSAFGALADYLDANLPADRFVPAAPAAPAIQGVTGGEPLDRITQQLAELAKQVESLRSGKPPETKSAPMPATPTEPKRFGPYKPIDRSAAASGFTPRQQAHLDALIARYTARTPKSKAFTQQHRPCFADPRAVSGFRPFWKEMVYPIVAERSKGSRIWDIDGNEFVDMTMGFGTNLFGHSPDFVTEAVRKQLELGVEVGPTSPLAGEAAELFCKLTGHERVTFCSTGSEATLGAIRLARTVTGRTRIATTSEAYHGINDEVLVRSAGGRPFPVAPGIPEHAVSEVLVLDWGNPAALETLRAHAHELACVIVETVQSRRPEIQPAEFIREIRRITQESGTALILDEVITGFRVHPRGVQGLWNIRADIAAYGKVIGGGMPVGAIAGRAEYMNALDGGPWQYGDNSFPEVGVTFFAGTYVRHPLAMAAAVAVFRHLIEAGPDLQRDLSARTDRFTAELNAEFEAAGAPVHATHFASMMYFQFGEAFRHPGLLFYHLREKGVHIWEGRPWFLSTAHTAADVQFVLNAFRETIRELKEGGFIGESAEAIAVPERKAIAAEPEKPAVPAVVAEPEIEVLPPLVPVAPVAARAPLFSVYYFGSYPAPYSESKYRLIVEGTRLADAQGFHAVWLPERHFHAVGGFSPNPSVLAAALARETSQIRIHGGSVVVPLHHPVRIAEEWSVVDNLSHGRAGISFASGWHPNDFVLSPGNYERRRELYYEGIQTIRKLWRGESVQLPTGTGTTLDVQLHPMPCQAELPMWFTCIHRDAFVKAGELGGNVLCHTVNHSLEEIAGKIAAYREARARAGFDRGHVTILVHTYLAEDPARAVEEARRPFYDYLSSFLDNGKKKAESHGRQVDVAQEDMDEILALSYSDYVENKALIGSVESCAEVIDRLVEIGVDELGCFVDFGVETDLALKSLERVAELRRRTNARFAAPETFPLTGAERGLWTLVNTSDNGSRAYNESITLKLGGPVRRDALLQALQTLVDRHEALRTVVKPDGDLQEVLPACEANLEFRDFSTALNGTNGTREAGILAYFAEREAALFDFTKAPLLRASLAKRSDSEHLLLLTFHHLLGNGPAYTIFLEELTQAYDAIAGGKAPRFERVLQLHDFVAWRAAQERTQGESEQFWLNQFSGGVPVLDLPADRPRPAAQTFRGGREVLMLDEPLAKALRAAAAHRRSSLFMFLFSAYGVLLRQLSGQEDIVIGVSSDASIRAEDGGRAIFANTTHVMPLRCRIDSQAPFSAQVAASKALVLDASEHQEYFFGDLVRKLNLPRDPSRNPLFSVTFNLETGEFRQAAGGVDFEWQTAPYPYRGPRGTAMFDLYLNIAERNGGLLCELDFSEIFAPETAQRWLAHFRTLLEQAARDPEQPVSALPRPDSAGNAKRIELWPSTPSAGGDQVFDEVIYNVMSADRERNDCFREAFARTVRGKSVIDIGTGKDAILARLCVEAGARKVYAVELLETAAQQARQLVRELGMEDRIDVVQGDVRTLRLPEPAEVCVSENVGHIGGAEGWDLVLAQATHLLKPGAPMIPSRCETKIAAVSLPREFLDAPKFSELSAYYVENLFRQAGYPFDLRLSITGTGREHLCSSADTFERIDFTAPRAKAVENIRLAVSKEARIDGFLLWLNIEMAPGIVLNTIDDQASWLPVYLPVFDGGLEVREGDVIEAAVESSLAENGRDRDYAISGAVNRGGAAVREFSFTSWHYKNSYKATPFYQRLFASGKLPVNAPDSAPAIDLAQPPNGQVPPAAAPEIEAAPLTPLQRHLAEIWQSVLGVERVGLHDKFFEIGGDSILGLRVINRLRTALNEYVSLVVIFEAPTIEKLAELLERNYAEAVHAWVGNAPAAETQDADTRIGEKDVARLQTLIVPMKRHTGGGPKNPPAVFILSPMRSGSTLLRIMLAGNPRLFAPPELQLLGFEDLAERRAASVGYDQYHLQEGAIRAVMEIRKCDAAEAESAIAQLEREGADMRQFYAQMQKWIEPRLLVDKTPEYAMNPGILRRMEDVFENPLYIHLARHPLGMIHSYEKGRFILESPYRGRHDFTARQMAELTWLISHRNIAGFLRGVPEQRQRLVRFEDFVAAPEPSMRALCEWMNIPFAPEMTDPYRGGSERMTDGVRPAAPQVGDANFYRHGRLNPQVARSWKGSYTEDFLSPLTWEIAAKLGYENPFETARARQATAQLWHERRRVRPVPGSSSIVAVQSEGPSAPLTPLFFLHGDFAEGGIYCMDMARQIGLDRPFYSIDPHGLDANTPRSIEEMAAQHLKLIRQVQPHGPYVLGGYCNGGLVAYEAAQQLEAAGEKVASLVLISANGSNTAFAWLKNLVGIAGPFSGKDRKFRSFLKWRERILFTRAAWQHQREALSRMRGHEQSHYIALKTARVAKRAMGLLIAKPDGEAAGVNPDAGSGDLGLIYQDACRAYVPRPFHGPAHLLWPEEMTVTDPTVGWSRVMPQLRVQIVPGGHFSVLEGENLRVVSEKIRECLAADHA